MIRLPTAAGSGKGGVAPNPAQDALQGDREKPLQLGRLVSLAGAALGLALAGLLISRIGLGPIVRVVLRTGWWLPLVVVLHTPQTLASAAGWRALLPERDRPSMPQLYLYRWIRESVNALLPVAQVGGEVVRARLLARHDMGVARAGASCALDVTLELAAQVAFTLLGLALLAAAVPRSPGVRIGIAALVGLGVVVALLALAQRLARVPRLQVLAMRLGRRWLRAPSVDGVPAAPFRARPGQQLRSTGWHLLSWGLGAVETLAALRALGLHATLGEATVVESLGQVVRVAAFAVPGAVGVQEGGLVLICGLFAIAPASAIALSLLRRLREVALGAPGLLAWRLAERRSAKASASRLAERRPPNAPDSRLTERRPATGASPQ